MRILRLIEYNFYQNYKNILSIIRNEKSSVVNDMLSEESRLSRKRIEIVGFQTNFLAWIVEFATGFIMLLDFLLGIDVDNKLFRIFLPVDIMLCCVVIPGCYVSKTEKFRIKIYNIGWDQIFFGFCIDRKTRVSPSLELPIHQQPNARSDPENNTRESTRKENQSEQPCQHNQDQEDEDENWWMKIQLFDEENE